jgi:hypothetical protein
MNELDLLEKHGPAATPVAADTLRRARALLMDEIAAETTGDLDGTQGGSRPDRQGGRARWLRGGAAAAAAAAALAVLMPSLLGTGATAAIALAPADPLTFPLTPISVPVDLGQPVFDKEPGLALAVYAGQGSDRVMVSVRDDEARGQVPVDARDVEISGHDAKLFSGSGSGSVSGSGLRRPTTSLVWQDDDGDRVAVTGRGRYAEAGRLTDFARALRDRPLRVDLQVELVPQGWEVRSYKANVTVTFGPPGGGDGLTVNRLAEMSADFAGAYGAYAVSRVSVHGQPGALGRQDAEGRDRHQWVLEARASEGQVYSLIAPDSFTRAQVLDVAEGVVIGD